MSLNQIKAASLLKKIFLNKTLYLCLFLFSVTFTVFIFGFKYQGSKDMIPSKLLPISIIYDRDLYLNEFVCPFDEETQTFKYDPDACLQEYWWKPIQGKAVSVYPIIPGFLNVPAHYLAYTIGIDIVKYNQLLSFLTSAAIASFSVVLMFLLLEQVSKRKRTALFFSLIYAFCTAVWSVASQGMWQHGPSLLFITIALLLIYKKNPRWLPWAGFFLGFAVFNRPTNILIALPLTVYIFFHHRAQFWRYCFLGAIPAALLIVYSYSHIGTIAGLGQVQALTMKGSFVEGFLGLMFSPARGLFVFSPIFIMGLFYLPRIFSKKEEAITKYLFVSLILVIVAYSKWKIWWGGHSFGYRLIVESIPILIIITTKSWTEIISKKKILMVIFAILVAISFYIHFLGAQLHHCEFNTHPNNIDRHPERLWHIRDTELERCHKIFYNSTTNSMIRLFLYLKLPL